MRISSCSTRTSGDVLDGMRVLIGSGKVQIGRYLQSERAIAAQYGVSEKTVRRALKVLEDEGLIKVEPRKGYRVLAARKDDDRSTALTAAFVYAGPATSTDEAYYQRLLGQLQLAAGRRNIGLLGLRSEGNDAAGIMERIRKSGASSVILETMKEGLLEQIERAGIPAVMVTSWLPAGRFDAVVQDGFSGGFQAASWLAERGHKRIGFFGHFSGSNLISLERFSGALGTLAASGIDIPADLRVNAPFGTPEDLLPAAREWLSRSDRPIGILALWQSSCHALIIAARELNLKLGRDLDIVGWSTLEDYPDLPSSELAPHEIPPMIVWSVRELAEAAVARLLERRAQPDLPVVVTRLPVSLRLPRAKQGEQP